MPFWAITGATWCCRLLCAVGVMLTIQPSPATAQANRATTLSVQYDNATRQGLLATGLLHPGQQLPSKKEIGDALTRFRLIYLNDQPTSADVEIRLLKSFFAKLESRFHLTLNKDNVGRHILVPRKLLATDKVLDKTQTMYTSKNWRAQLYTFRWQSRANPPQEFMNSIFLKGTKGTYQALRFSSQEFAIRGRSIRKYRSGTEYVRHQINRSFVVNGHLVGAYFTFLDEPEDDFSVPEYIAPQVAYWRRALIRFNTPDSAARRKAIRAWSKSIGLLDLSTDELIALPVATDPQTSPAVERMLRVWAWRQTMAGLGSVILKPFHDDNRQVSVAVSGCHASRSDNHPDYQEVRILFATNRKRIGEIDASHPDPDRWFDIDSDKLNQLHLGCAMMSVPKKTEALDALQTQFSGSWFGGKNSLPENDAELYRVTRAAYLGPVDPKASRYRLRLEDLERDRFDDESRALVFVHGYNTSFEYALLVASQMAAAIRYQGRVYLFSWPSGSGFRSYMSDMDSAERSEFHLAGFIRALYTDPELRKLDIVAHSMGSQMMLRALTDLGDLFYSRHDVSLGQLVFAAPDVSDAVFKDKIREVRYLADDVTVYSSANDKALMLSKFLRRDGSRVGLMTSREELTRISNVDYIDATSTNTGCNLWGWYGMEHGYFASNPIVRKHISSLLTRRRKTENSYAKVRKRIRRVGLGLYKLDVSQGKCWLQNLRIPASAWPR